MADDDDAGDKSEEPTERRREEFREEGQVAKSQDLNSFFVLLAGLSYLFF
jgi:flagellar biosynthetic protein FlhB